MRASESVTFFPEKTAWNESLDRIIGFPLKKKPINATFWKGKKTAGKIVTLCSDLILTTWEICAKKVKIK